MENSNFISQAFHNSSFKVASYSCKIHLRSDYTRKDGTNMVYVQILINGQKLTYTTGVKVRKDEWDEKKQCVKPKAMFASDYNTIINHYRTKVHEVFRNMTLSDTLMSMENFKKHIQLYEAKGDFVKYCEESVKSKQRGVEQGTYERYINSIKKLKEYREVISFADLNTALLVDYNYWLQHTKRNNQNTRSQEMKTLSMFISKAKKDGVRFKNPFDDYKIPSQSGRIEYLKPAEVKELIHIYRNMEDGEKLKKHLRAFLLMVFTGMRVSDLVKVKRHQFDGRNITFVPTKTKKKGRIIYAKVTELAAEFLNPEGDYLGIDTTPDNLRNRMNELKRAYKIKFKVNCHIARHTFATLFILNGGTAEALRSILDHHSLDETMKYVHECEKYIGKNMDNAHEEIKKYIDA